MIQIKYVAAALAAIFLFVAGYQYAAAQYEADLAELREKHARLSKDLTNEYRIKENAAAKRLAEAWQEVERARAESVDLRADVERVRNQAARLERRLSQAGDGSCSAYREHAARGAELGQRGAALLERCVELASKCSINKDAISGVLVEK